MKEVDYGKPRSNSIAKDRRFTSAKVYLGPPYLMRYMGYRGQNYEALVDVRSDKNRRSQVLTENFR